MPLIHSVFAKYVTPLKLVEIGSMMLGEREDSETIRPLAKQPGVTLIGFEPQSIECDKLNKRYNDDGMKFLPYAIGDGEEHVFYETALKWTSGIYPPNIDVMGNLNFPDSASEIVNSFKTKTKRLDDIPETWDADLLKLDTEGAELMILENGQKALSNALVIDIELNLLENQVGGARYYDVTKLIEEAGFTLSLFEVMRKSFKPWNIPGHPNVGFAQVFAAEAVFVKDWRRADDLTGQQLAKIGVIMQDLYGFRNIFDVANYYFRLADKKLGTDLFQQHADFLGIG